MMRRATRRKKAISAYGLNRSLLQFIGNYFFLSL